MVANKDIAILSADGEANPQATSDSLAPQHYPRVTLVVVPRERFSCTQESLESIFQNTEIPFQLIYVDGNSPPPIRRYLENQALVHDFLLIQKNTFLSPNQARNIGLRQVKTPYVVFIDNDVIVSPGWLTHLVTCADETGAAIVGPLMCQDRPLHQTVHFAGGEAHIFTDVHGKRHLREKMYGHLKKIETTRHRLRREPTELVEFHCMLVRTNCFEHIGPLDEAILNTKEHMDFCMMAIGCGESIYFEPESVVTYVPEPPQNFTDAHFYMLRWSDAWAKASITRLQEKWQLTADKYFENTYRRARSRRVMTFIDPLTQQLGWANRNQLLHKLLRGGEKYLNWGISFYHACRSRMNISSSKS